jgi:hypothetical protein
MSDLVETTQIEQEVEETRQAYPTNFLCQLSERLAKAIDELQRTYGMPKSERKAFDEAIYLAMLIEKWNHPEEFPRGLEQYNIELRASVEDVSWLIDQLEDVRRSRVARMPEEEYRTLSTLDSERILADI